MKHLSLLAALCCLVGLAQAGEVFKWTDAQGRVHFGDKPPKEAADKAQPVEVKTTPVSEAQRKAANDRTAKLKATLGGAGGGSSLDGGQGAGMTGTSASNGDRACQAAWRAYQESQACFQGQRLDNGKLDPSASDKCQAVPEPAPCR